MAELENLGPMFSCCDLFPSWSSTCMVKDAVSLFFLTGKKQPLWCKFLFGVNIFNPV